MIHWLFMGAHVWVCKVYCIHWIWTLIHDQYINPHLICRSSSCISDTGLVGSVLVTQIYMEKGTGIIDSYLSSLIGRKKWQNLSNPDLNSVRSFLGQSLGSMSYILINWFQWLSCIVQASTGTGTAASLSTIMSFIWNKLLCIYASTPLEASSMAFPLFHSCVCSTLFSETFPFYCKWRAWSREYNFQTPYNPTLFSQMMFIQNQRIQIH